MAFGDAPGKPLIRYVTPDLSDGWLNVHPENGGEKFSLPSFLKVAVYKEEGLRAFFTVLEGKNKGRKASVGQLTGKPFLVEGVSRSSGASVRLHRGQQRLWYGSSGPFFAFSGAYVGERVFTAIPAGTYSLQIPDAPHKSNRYSAYTSFQKVWFPILGKGVSEADGRFLHVGELSDGCVTVRAFVFDAKAPKQEPLFRDWERIPESQLGGWGYPYPKAPLPPLASWDDIYKYLIRSRENDQAVGTLVVE